jgi:hypothetical protein
MRLPRGLVNVVWSAVFLLALPLARAQEMASSVSDSSVEAAASAPTCWPSDSPLSCTQLCLLNGYPSCDYCHTPCPPTCRPPDQGGLQCMQLCMNNGYPSCDYCNTPCAPTCRPANQGGLQCMQLCMNNGYPSCDYCNTPCPPACRPANQGALQCMQICTNNGYSSCNYCNTPCASSALLQDTEMSTALACQ